MSSLVNATCLEHLVWDACFQSLWKGKTGSSGIEKSSGSVAWSDEFTFPWDQHAACQVALDSSHLHVIYQDEQTCWVGIN